MSGLESLVLGLPLVSSVSVSSVYLRRFNGSQAISEPFYKVPTALFDEAQSPLLLGVLHRPSAEFCTQPFQTSPAELSFRHRMYLYLENGLVCRARNRTVGWVRIAPLRALDISPAIQLSLGDCIPRVAGGVVRQERHSARGRVAQPSTVNGNRVGRTVGRATTWKHVRFS